MMKQIDIYFNKIAECLKNQSLAWLKLDKDEIIVEVAKTLAASDDKELVFTRKQECHDVTLSFHKDTLEVLHLQHVKCDKSLICAVGDIVVSLKVSRNEGWGVFKYIMRDGDLEHIPSPISYHPTVHQQAYMKAKRAAFDFRETNKTRDKFLVVVDNGTVTVQEYNE